MTSDALANRDDALACLGYRNGAFRDACNEILTHAAEAFQEPDVYVKDVKQRLQKVQSLVSELQNEMVALSEQLAENYHLVFPVTDGDDALAGLSVELFYLKHIKEHFEAGRQKIGQVVIKGGRGGLVSRGRQKSPMHIFVGWCAICWQCANDKIESGDRSGFPGFVHAAVEAYLEIGEGEGEHSSELRAPIRHFAQDPWGNLKDRKIAQEARLNVRSVESLVQGARFAPPVQVVLREYQSHFGKKPV